MTLAEFAKLMDTALDECRPKLQADVVKIGELVKAKAKEMIGHELPLWPPLRPATVADKARRGYVGRISATDPLYREGSLRESIAMDADPAALAVIVGSNDRVGAYQEIGTSKMPPRPFLMPAMMQSQEAIAEKLGKSAVSLLVPWGER
jgi:HK97 gp10 family phage protein